MEDKDPNGEVLPQSLRAEATLKAQPPPVADLRAGRSGELTEEEEAFVVRRAGILHGELVRRFPSAASIANRAGWFHWITPVLAGAAFLLGLFSNEFGPEKRVNIIAFPLLGMIVWNVVIYVLLIFGLRWPGRGGPNAQPVGALAAGIVHFVGSRPSALAKGISQEPIAAGFQQFLRDWLSHGAAANAARARLALHSAAAALALGAVAGMYLRGLALEYEAGWESTFLDADSVHAVLSILLAPASWLTSIPIPDARSIAALRWNASAPGGAAAPWIHLYAATAGWLIVVPRLVLAGIEFARARRALSRFHPIGQEDAYFRRVLASIGGEHQQVSVLFYQAEVEPHARERLRSTLLDGFGWKARIDFATPIRYGDEDELGAAIATEPEPACRVIVFHMTSTPEEENQGAVLEKLKSLALEANGGRKVLVLVDESAFRSRFSAQAGFEKRLEERRKLWRRFVEGHGLTPVVTHLENSAPNPEALREHAWPGAHLENRPR